ncbi:alpha/beta hydrolase, partial [Streptomyces albiflaviniger]|nr:alpha/beta hydrolase [Streptomyces albiflaviniger]
AVFQSMLAAAADARTTEARGETPPVLTLFPDTVEQARALGGEHGAEGFAYYRTPRARHPRSAGFLTWTSVRKQYVDPAVEKLADFFGEHLGQAI